MAQETCIECGIVFAMPDVLHAEFRRSHKSFFCPNGHRQYYPGKSDLEIANERIAQLETIVKAKSEAMKRRQENILALERQRAALRAVITRFKNQRRKNDGR
ncbi:MAG: hypothetical protein ABSB91_00410 [Sedimentisphaerales bacterium]|jgi:hypothetical protein